MKKQTRIFGKDMEIPNIVNQKMEEAFEIIGTEINASKVNVRKNKVRKIEFYKKYVAVFASICILALGSLTAFAAYNHFWSRGMKGTLSSTDEQQHTLVDEGMAVAYDENDSYKDMAVTNGGVTVTPKMLVSNDNIVYLSLSVEGYDLREGETPCFENIDVYLGSDKNNEECWLNVNSFFYDGIVLGEDGIGMYDNGTALETDENGRVISLYSDAEGKMEYIIIVMVNEPNDSFLGKTLHVDLSNLGTVYNTDSAVNITGKWDYAFNLPAVGDAEAVKLEKSVEGTEFVLDSIEISPVSIKSNFTVNGEVSGYEDDNGVPAFRGVVLKDGTRLTYLGNASMSGYEDDSHSKAYDISAFNQVIEPDQVASLLFKIEDRTELIEIDILNRSGEY